MDKESQGKEAVPVEANQSHAEMDRYILAVTERFFAMKDLLSMHILAPLFYGKGTMEKCPEPYRAQVYELIREAEAVRREGELCCTEITEKQSEAIQRLGDLEEHGIKAPATAKPLFMVIHELFNETLRLGALVAQAISILKDLTHTLELAGNKNKDFEDIAERLKKDMAEMHKTLLETMLDTSAKITDHDARTTADHREHDTKLEGMDAKVTATRNEAREQLPGRVTAGMAAAALCKAFASAKLDPEATATKLRQRLRKAKLKDVITLDNRGTKAYRIADVLDIVKAHCAASRKPGSMDPGDASRFLAELTDIPGRVRNPEET